MMMATRIVMILDGRGGISTRLTMTSCPVTTEAAATLNELNFIYPEDEDLHRRLGALWMAQGNKQGAVRE